MIHTHTTVIIMHHNKNKTVLKGQLKNQYICNLCFRVVQIAHRSVSKSATLKEKAKSNPDYSNGFIYSSYFCKHVLHCSPALTFLLVRRKCIDKSINHRGTFSYVEIFLLIVDSLKPSIWLSCWGHPLQRNIPEKTHETSPSFKPQASSEMILGYLKKSFL